MLPYPMLSCALDVSCQAATSCLTSSQHGKQVELLTQGAGLSWSLKCSYSFIRTISHNANVRGLVGAGARHGPLNVL